MREEVDMENRILAMVINVDWYFNLHWVERANYFKSKGFSVHVISNFTEKSIKKELTDIGFSCHQLPLIRSNINFIKEFLVFFELKKLLSSINPDLIHCITVKPNIYTGIINRFFMKKPIVYSVTGLGAIFSSRGIKFRILKRIIVILYRFVSVNKSRIIFENNEDCELFHDLGIINNGNGNGNGVVIKGAGIDLDRFLPSPPPLNRTILFAARLLRDKGLHELVEAKRILASRDVNFTLKVAGITDDDASSAISQKQITSWSTDGDIEWLGNISDMPNLIKQCDIVCLPTTYGEGVPRILIEAASCQRAIITTNVVGSREIVNHNYNGLLVEPSNSEDLAKALEGLLSDNEKIRLLGINGRRKAEEEFSQEVVFEKTLQVYEQFSISR